MTPEAKITKQIINLSEMRQWMADKRDTYSATDNPEVLEKLLDIVEVAKKYATAKRVVYGSVSTIEDFDRMNRLEIEVFRLLADVEIG